MNKIIKREIDVIIYGQPFWFRVMKYCVLIPMGLLLFKWWGWPVVIGFIGGGAVVGIALHFWFRWKTDGWKKSWGLYKTKQSEKMYSTNRGK